MKRKSFYSIKDFYFAVISIYFSSIEKTHHYKEVHEKHVSWSEVIETVLLSKSRRRKGNKIVIENKKYYILAELKGKILYITKTALFPGLKSGVFYVRFLGLKISH